MKLNYTNEIDFGGFHFTLKGRKIPTIILVFLDEMIILKFGEYHL